jgi:putative ABC transport system permease protein
MNSWWLRLRKRRALACDLHDEIAFHRRMRAADEHAPRFGNETLIREEMHEMWSFGSLETYWRDVRYALRGMRLNPGFAMTAILSLALGIGASIAIFTAADHLLVRPLPYRDPSRLVMVWEVKRSGTGENNVVSPANYRDWRSQNDVFAGMAGLGFPYQMALSESGEQAEEVAYRSATAEFFPLLGVQPYRGRFFTSSDGRPNSEAVAVLSHGLWQRRFGGDERVLGRRIQLDGRPTTVIGILPPQFYFLDRKLDVWLPLFIDPARDYRATSGRFMAVAARLRTGVTIDQANSAMGVIARRLEVAHERFNKMWGVNVEPLRETLVSKVKTSLFVLLGAVCLLWGVACANVANLLLARYSARQHELGVRLSVGAGRGRIVRQILTECALLGLLGGLGGVLIASFALRGLIALAPSEVSWAGAIDVDSRILLFAFVVSAGTGLLIGLIPAALAASERAEGRLRLNERLGSGGQNVRWFLVAGEVALSVLLLTGAGLLFRTMVRMQATPTGFDTSNLLTMKVSLPGTLYREPQRRTQFFADAIGRIQSLPGVRSAAAISYIPLRGIPAATAVTIEGRPDPGAGNEITASVRVVTPGFLRTAGTRLVRGREFDARDNRRSEPLRFLVNEAFVAKFMAGSDPLAHRISVVMSDENPFGQVVGVVSDVTDGTRDGGHTPSVYYPHSHLAFPSMNVLVRTDSEPSAIARPARQVIGELDSQVTVAEVATMDDVLDSTRERERFSATLLGAFSGFGLLLTAIGIYGVLRYTVTERTREIGVRVAIGAVPGAIAAMFVGRALRFAVGGALAGLAGAWAMGRFLETLLFETSPHDPATFAVSVAILIAVSLAAAWIPAARAARLNPVEALRAD